MTKYICVFFTRKIKLLQSNNNFCGFCGKRFKWAVGSFGTTIGDLWDFCGLSVAFGLFAGYASNCLMVATSWRFAAVGLR